MSIWKVEADILDFKENEKSLILRNPSIDLFLDETDSMGISASKGMGKTFILKIKRLENQTKSIRNPRKRH